MVIALAGMVGYIYFQQNKLLNAVQGLSSFVSSQFVPPIEADEEDDRASVEEEKEVEVVEAVAPPETKEEDVDDLQDKTSAELRELLSKKGLPYGKRDSKTTLLQLLKASA
jgi:Na+-transporting methylmalonyl-CoA/oxaloacetate decarboxylase gamma subunit